MKNKLLILVAVVALTLTAEAQVTYERLLKAPAAEPQNWLTFSGGYNGQRFSPLQQINTGNVQELAPQWIFQTGVMGKFEATPLVVDGVMYVTAQEDTAFALDARTGRPIWKYVRAVPQGVQPCCGHVNRGFAMLGDRVFIATLDAHIVALDSRTGNVIWDTEAADYRQGYTFTVAPLAVKDKVIVGVSGGEYGVRGFIDAYDAAKGKRVWRFYTVPQPGEPGFNTWKGDGWKRGGAPAWVTGSYDPELNLVYWATGNPSPSNFGGDRGGDNLYSNSVLALDADSGKLKWYFQFTPHDLHDWDATEVPVLLDAMVDGYPRKRLLHANRNGFFYVLDRSDGHFLFAKAFARQTWAKGIGPDGRPELLPGGDPTPEGAKVCPGAIGATNFMSPSYSPQTGLFYVNVREQCDVFTTAPQVFHAGRAFLGSAYSMDADEKDWGALRAIEPTTGEIKWEFKHNSAPWAGTLATAGGLVFAGDIEGNLIAFDAHNGKVLWHFETGSALYASPIAYSLNGRQYVAIASGQALVAFALPMRDSEKANNLSTPKSGRRR